MADKGGRGCYKCGRQGHWAKDCNAPPASAPASDSGPQAAGRKAGSKAGISRRNDGGTNKTGGAPRPRKMPKLTPDLLLSSDGLGYVLEKLPQQVTIRGRGHEVEDLKSLLEAYVRWHSCLLPYYSYSQFVEKVEKLGAAKRVRMCLRDLRKKVANGETGTLNGEAAEGLPDFDCPPPTDQGGLGGREAVANEVEEHSDPPVDLLDEYLREATAKGELPQEDKGYAVLDEQRARRRTSSKHSSVLVLKPVTVE